MKRHSMRELNYHVANRRLGGSRRMKIGTDSVKYLKDVSNRPLKTINRNINHMKHYNT